jgi:anti-sigma-K factor RskA
MSAEHERWSEDISAYVLGALEPGEAAELERHLEKCESCRAELRWLAPAVGALPESVASVEPPRRLRARLLAEVRADARGANAGANEERRGPSAWLRPLRFGRMGWWPAAGLAALVLAVAAVVGYEVGKPGPDHGGGVTYSARQGRVAATVVRAGQGGALLLSNVKQLPADRVLEAWVLRQGAVEAVPSLFVPDRAGRASTTISDLDGVEIVMVTKEPRGGSERPSGRPIVSVPIAG